ncbi:hypothetical protein AB0K66_17615 [Streptomyces werraensis]
MRSHEVGNAGGLPPLMLRPLDPLLLGEVVLVFGSRPRSWVSVRARPD